MKKRHYLLIYFLCTHLGIWSQTVTISKVIVDAESTFKTVYIQLEVDGADLNDLNRVRLNDKATAFSKETSEYSSDEFYSDDYLDNYDNHYTIAFDSIPLDTYKFNKLNGTLRLLYPSKGNKSLTAVNASMSNFNNNIIGQGLGDIRVVPIDGSLLKKLKRRKKKLFEFIEELVRQNGLNKSVLFESLDKYYEHERQFKTPRNISDNIIFYIEHPTFKVVSISIVDPNDNDKQFVGSRLNGPESAIWMFRNFRSKLSDKITIEVVNENPKSLEYVDFEFFDVDLETEH